MRETFEKLSKKDLRQVGLVAFAVGVVIHACVIYAVLDDGPAKSAAPAVPGPAPQSARPTPTPLQDRRICDEVRGTQYRSDNERLWFLQNCTAG